MGRPDVTLELDLNSRLRDLQSTPEAPQGDCYPAPTGNPSDAKRPAQTKKGKISCFMTCIGQQSSKTLGPWSRQELP